MTEHSSASKGLDIPEQEFDPAVFREGNPWRVVADLNEACNISCDYCHIDALFGKEARDSRTLDPNLVGTLLHDADRMKVFDVTLTGGEITIMPNLMDYLEEAKDLDFTSVQIITNGTRLSEGLATELKDVGIQRVSISIDGPEESNDRARGDKVWRRAWRGVENAVDAGLGVNVISVLGKHNIDDWHELPPLLKQAGVVSQNISLMCRLGRAETADEWMGIPEDRLDEIRLKVKKLQEELNDESFFLTMNDGVTQEPGWSGEPTPIHAFQDQNPGIEAVVKVNGDILRNRLYGRNRSIGNLATASLSEIWQQDRAHRAQIDGVVGEDNVGTLPSLYYHYDQEGRDSSERVMIPKSDTTYHQDRQRDIRVREESWGTVQFDARTFAIVDVAMKASTGE